MSLQKKMLNAIFFLVITSRTCTKKALQTEPKGKGKKLAALVVLSLMFLGAAFFAANGLKEMSKLTEEKGGRVDWATEFTKEDLKNLDTMAAFESWHKTFEKNYATQTEEANRYAIWLENLEKIAESNSKDLTYKLRLNQCMFFFFEKINKK
ncbi:hypothetical protein RFI_17875 [Reticulomyxa filosa]|uniref:Cathepsin propeptide inhibitor domain-containing protein n=1 Tax=Reticulomyxa filosa TaxID=46433 RepID=X6N234_RETFI|nr:hypothetical protein RFI_17875 [Reticulomyxa filosa]|eukprot:ETO19357.1 hypothetical protein RFI_17875 [Reticulomyxa filosa]